MKKEFTVNEMKMYLTAGYIKNHICIEIGQKSKWLPRLKGIMHESLKTDLVAIYRVSVPSGSYILSSTIAAHAGLMPDDIIEGKKKYLAKEKYICKTLPEIMSKLSGSPIDEFESGETIYVLTTENMLCGSSVILREDILNQVADSFGGEMYIIPSSIHEVLCVKKDIMSYGKAAKMIQEINSSVVEERDIMSDHPYIYKKEVGFIEPEAT